MKRPSNVSSWIKLILRVLVVAAVFIGMYSYAMFQGGFVSWFLFYSITVLVVLMLLYAAIPLGSFHVKRELGDGAVIAGADYKVTVTIRRRWPFPFLYLSVTDHIEDNLKRQLKYNHSKMIFYPTLKRELTYTYTIPNAKRGEYVLYGVELSTSDMFGFFYKKTLVELEDTILVYPNYHEIERWSALENRETETTLSSLDFIEDVTSVAGAREYVPGDKLTSIDWKVTARSSKLMTKEFEEYTGQRFLIVLNNHLPNMEYETLEAYEKSVELATSLVMHSSRNQIQVGLWTVGKESAAYPIDSGPEQQKRLIYHLAKIRGDSNGDFAKGIKEYDDKIPLGTTLLIASTELTDGMLERIRIYLSRRTRVYFCLLDREIDSQSTEMKRFEQLKRYGAEAYLLSGGNIDHAIPSYAGD
ncbi:DUF58 domain-containing protein [Evansella sp. AB-rgal1]|uniref:DUF58 domain-containing protein n=1 Tax=Evansella sp. AB-rgal1 TaxID=3242696 RepID=UPI00359DB51A